MSLASLVSARSACVRQPLTGSPIRRSRRHRLLHGYLLLTHGALGDCDPARGEALVLRGLRGLLMSARGESCAGGCGCSPSAWLRFSSGITGGSIARSVPIESLRSRRA